MLTNPKETIVKLARRVILVAIAAFAALGAGHASAQKVYNIASLGDYTGPFAQLYAPVDDSRRAVIDWWNQDVGAKERIQVRMKTYDTRYDAGQTASLWPGIKSELKPVAILGLGGPDFAALQARLPDDKVPLLASAGAYGFAWKPDPWAFLSRPTYGHEAGAFINWMSQRLGRPVRFAVVSSEASVGFADLAKGIQMYAKENPQKANLIETVYTEPQPADLTLQMRRVTSANPDVIVTLGTLGHVIATKRALQTLGKKIPILVSAHNGLMGVSGALGGMAAVEGDYEAHGSAIATMDQSEARAFYDMLQKRYALKAPWNGFTIMGLSQTVIILRAIERAAKKVGADNVTGVDVRNALLGGTFSSADLFGLLPDMQFKLDAPFPTVGSSINIGTVQGGKLVDLAQRVPVPVLSKW